MPEKNEDRELAWFEIPYEVIEQVFCPRSSIFAEEEFLHRKDSEMLEFRTDSREILHVFPTHGTWPIKAPVLPVYRVNNGGRLRQSERFHLIPPSRRCHRPSESSPPIMSVPPPNLSVAQL